MRCSVFFGIILDFSPIKWTFFHFQPLVSPAFLEESFFSAQQTPDYKISPAKVMKEHYEAFFVGYVS